jgi:hypothetical protein
VRLRTLAAATAAITGLLVPATAGACSFTHLGVRWGSFQAPLNDLGPTFFYMAVEPPVSSSVPVTIKGTGDDCTNPPQPVVASYQVSAPPSGTTRAATAGVDYTAIYPPRTTGPLYGYHAQGPTEHVDTVPVLSDVLPETVVEQAQALLTGTADGGRLDFPFDVPFYIVDDDGPDRASFENAGPFERSETYGVITVPVFRAGPAATAATYDLSAAGSSTNPATAGEDYKPVPASVSFAAGERVKLVTVEIVNDGRFEEPEELTLTLTNPGTVLPDDPVTATVRILNSLGASVIESRLHHPRQRFTYRASDYRIREVHIFTQAGQGAPISTAQFALRRNSKGGRCDWWTGKRFKKGDCQNERWLGTDRYEPDFFYIRLDQLAPSKGKIKSYTAYSRAENGTGEIEAFFEKGRNQNTFEVKPAKR